MSNQGADQEALEVVKVVSDSLCGLFDDSLSGNPNLDAQRILSALADKGYTVIKTEALVEAQAALREATITALTVKPLLDKPYPDDPRWTPWTRWVDRAAARCFDARRALAKAIPPQTQRAISKPVSEGDGDVA